MNLEAEMDDAPTIAEKRAFFRGMKFAAWLWAVWRDGEQYVGATKTLKQANASIDEEERKYVDGP